MRIKRYLGLFLVLVVLLMVTSCKKKKYEVTFLDYDDQVLEVITVKKGDNANAPKDPTREGYTFLGWDGEYSNVKKNIEVKAKYEIKEYTVTFKDHEGNTLKTEDVKYGSSATAPPEPTK